MLSKKEDAINFHRMLKGKIEIQSRISPERVFEIEIGEVLGLIYTPNVSFVAAEIANNKELAYDCTSKWNNVAIVCDGSRVLSLGNIGAEGAIPVIEGKSVLYYYYLGNIQSFHVFQGIESVTSLSLCILVKNAARKDEEYVSLGNVVPL